MKSKESIIALTLFALGTPALLAADYVKGYTTGSTSQLLRSGGGKGAVLFLDQAATGNSDQTADAGNPLWGWEVDGSSSWTSGDRVKITGIAMPFWANSPTTTATSNTQNALHKVRIYSCGPNNTYNGTDTAATNDDTLLGTVEVNFTLAGTGVDTFYVNFDTPVVWTSVNSNKIFFHIEAVNLPADPAGTRALRYKSGAPGAAAILKNRTNGATTSAGGASTTRLSIAGTVNEKVWFGDGNATANWDTTSSNWDAGASTYANGNSAIFNDAYDGFSKTVNLTSALSPSAITVGNTTAGSVPEYVFTGTGGLTGNMSLLREGNGTLTLSNTGGNNYTGLTTIRTGSIKLGIDNVLSAASVLQIGGTGTSKLLMNGFDAEIGGLQSLGNNTRAVNNTIAGSTLTINVAGTASYSYGSNFEGGAPVDLVKTGSGTQSLVRTGGFSTSPGNIAVNGGTLVWNANGNTGTVSVAANATLKIGNASANGSIGSIVSGTTGVLGDINIANDGLVIISRSDNTSYGHVISGAGALQVSGLGTHTFNAAQSYTGATTINEGVLVAGLANTLPATTVLTVGGSGGTAAFELNGFNQTVGGLNQGAGTKELRNNGPAASTFTINTPAATSFFYAANIQGSGVIHFVKNGPGTQEMTRAGGYSTDAGDVTVNDGILIWNVGDTYGNVTVNHGGNLVLAQTATAASFTVASGSGTASYNWAGNWNGSTAGTDWSLFTTTGNFTIQATQPSFTIVIDDTRITNFSENNASFTIATVGGTMGATTADFTVDQSAFTLGSGIFSAAVVGNEVVLTYTSGASPYESWAQTNITAIQPAAPAGFTDDADNDGIDNGVEFVLGGNPLASDTSILPVTTVGASNINIAYTRSADSIGSTTQAVQWSPDLQNWTSITVTGSDTAVSINVPRANEEGGKLFTRLVVTPL